MNSFFKTFLAALLAVFVFTLLAVLIFIGVIAGFSTPEPVNVGKKAVLVVDLSQPILEQKVPNPLSSFGISGEPDAPGLYDVVQVIHHSIGDSAIKGIYLKCGTNNQGMASSEELRNALLKFSQSGKFIIAYADMISQSSYHVASLANKIYCSPLGGVDWKGLSFEFLFLKGTLEKLDIEPQIFYAGKYKSATEPFREKKMTPANREQNLELLQDIYAHMLVKAGEARGKDTAQLRKYAEDLALQFPEDALNAGLIDGIKYDDEVKAEIAHRLGDSTYDKLNFITLAKYAKAVNYEPSGLDRIAVIYAQGDIIDGKGEGKGTIGGDQYRELIRTARMDKRVKAIVLRINSGGGSALASETMWREIELAKEKLPVVVSFSDVAASGGYYMAAGADSIFAQPNTITGSIGVFSLLPNLQGFLNNKLGITFDEVSTGPVSHSLTVVRPLSPIQEKWMQRGVDSVYHLFKARVAEGRKMTMEYVDSIGQGRIWTGSAALKLGLVDYIGGMQDAVDCAARMAKLDKYRLRSYPEPQSILDQIFGEQQEVTKLKLIKEELGEESVKTYSAVKRLKTMASGVQARLPFDFFFY